MPPLARWVWHSSSLAARIARLPLETPAAGLGIVARARARAYAHGWLRSRRLPRPSIAVGNLTVGGTGKTPLASWIAAYCADHGARPAILLRGGKWGDEALVHRALLPGVPVVENPDRAAGAGAAVGAGADVLVLDDAFQRLDVERDLNILLVSADSNVEQRLFPAGPAREGLDAARRADWIVVTRKSAGLSVARGVASRMQAVAPSARLALAEIAISGFAPLFGGLHMAPGEIAGRAVIASAGVGDPASFGAQLEQLGARVRRVDWPDHHRFTARDVARLITAREHADHLIVTEKDAVKLRALWPAAFPEPLVARAQVRWDEGGDLMAAALDRVLRARTTSPTTTHL